MKNTSIRVAVGIVFDKQKKLLIAQRPKGKHLAGLWEFPGGKVEQGESKESALIRELDEEIGIIPTDYDFIKEIQYEYDDTHVTLLVFKIHEFQGHAKGLERQAIKWVEYCELKEFTFPKANEEIIALIEEN